VLYATRIGNIERLSIEALNSPLSTLKFPAEFDSKLAAAAEYYNPMLHSFAA
jgi:hypothetical protein